MNKQEILVSFIIPCYNVELYVEKCIRSIMNQNYNRIEIIPVDDGSTDSTSKVIDQLSAIDIRVKPIHKKNEGVSIARNTGIDNSHGDYIVFVDGDDFVAPEYTDYMLNIAEQTKADFCMSIDCFVSDNDNQSANSNIDILKPEDATALLLSDRVVVGCWNKMFRKSLLQKNNIRFSSDLFYGEGLRFITTVSQLTNCVGLGYKKVYFYRKNNEESACTKFDIKKYRNGIESLNEIQRDLRFDTKKLLKVLAFHNCQFRMRALIHILSANKKEEYREDYLCYLSYVRKHSFQFVLSKYVPLFKQILLVGTCISPVLMTRLSNWRQRQIMKNSVK